MAQGVDVQIGRDRDRPRRNNSDVAVFIGSGGVTVGPRQNCRMVTTTVERADGRSNHAQRAPLRLNDTDNGDGRGFGAISSPAAKRFDIRYFFFA